MQTETSNAVERALRLNDQALKLAGEGRYEQAIPLAEEALAIGEKVWRINHDNNQDNLPTLLTNLANLYQKSGNLTRAKESYDRALAIYNRLGRDTLEVARTLNNLAWLLFRKGDYLNAEALYERALKIRQARLGPEHSLVAESLDNIAHIYSARGDFQNAILHHREAVAIYRKKEGAEADLATALYNLGLAYTETNDYALAEPLFQEALLIQERIQDVRPSLLNGFGRLLRRKGDLKAAEKLYQRALAIHEERPNAFAEDFSITLNNLALLYPDFVRAERLYSRALATADKAFGSEHPTVASILTNLSILYERNGRTAEAIDLRTRANEILERNLRLILATGSQDEKRGYVDTLKLGTNDTIWLHVHSAPMNKKAARLALTTILQRKGRELDAMADQFSALRGRATADGQSLLDQLTAAHSKLANIKFSGGPEGQKQISELEAKVDRLEAAISQKSVEFRMQSKPITLERIQAAIPEGAALVEIYPYFSYALLVADDRRFAVRYVAYVLRREGDPAFVSLGKTEPMGKAVRLLREALAYPESANAKNAGRALNKLLMRRLLPLLTGVKHILLSPTHELNVVPFAALVDEQNRYLVEKYQITYLTSGRDLLRIDVPVPSKQEPFVIANAAFGATSADSSPAPSPTSTSESTQRGAQARDTLQAPWTPLEGTEEEAKIIKGLFPNAHVLTGSEATEAAVKRISAPEILHLSTHGLFQPRPADSANQGSTDAPVETDSPMLRSALIFAGANQRQSGAGEDGILTALEASTLDLFGTKLVVLSACETGLGDFRRIGEGVYGLRRALVLAGSASQIMSLWQVDTTSTRELMVKYYEKLLSGKGRSEALREVQLEMLKRPERAHPFYWASFMPIGDWRSLNN